MNTKKTELEDVLYANKCMRDGDLLACASILQQAQKELQGYPISEDEESPPYVWTRSRISARLRQLGLRNFRVEVQGGNVDVVPCED